MAGQSGSRTARSASLSCNMRSPSLQSATATLTFWTRQPRRGSPWNLPYPAHLTRPSRAPKSSQYSCCSPSRAVATSCRSSRRCTLPETWKMDRPALARQYPTSRCPAASTRLALDLGGRLSAHRSRSRSRSRKTRGAIHATLAAASALQLGSPICKLYSADSYREVTSSAFGAHVTSR